MIRRYAELIGSLGPMVDRTGLDVLPVDLAMILLRPAVWQYVEMHSISESYSTLTFGWLHWDMSLLKGPGRRWVIKHSDFYALAVEGKGKDTGTGKEKGKGDKGGKGKANKDSNAKGKGLGPHREQNQVFWNFGKTCRFGRDCKQKPIHDAKEKTPGNKGSKGAKSGKKNDGTGRKKGDGKEEAGKANFCVEAQPEAGSSRNGQGHEAPLIFHDFVFTKWFWKFSGLRVVANLSWRCHEFFWFARFRTAGFCFEICNATRFFSGSCHEGSFMLCTAPRRPHLGMADIFHPVVISRQEFNQIALADFLDLNLFPETSTACIIFPLCCPNNFRMRYSACERGGWSRLTSKISWKPVDCDWWLFDSVSFSVVSSEAASHYYLSRDLTVTGSSKEFSSANGSSISMKSFATLEVIFWAWDQHDHCEKPIHLYIHCLIADHDT